MQPTQTQSTTVPPLEIKFKKEPHAQQEEFIDRDEIDQLYGGAKRGGKSVALCQKSTLLNVMFPGNRGLLARYNFTDLQDTTLTEFFETVPSELILQHHKGERTIILRTIHPKCGNRSAGTKDGWSEFASRQLYRGLGDPDEFEKVKGISLGHLEIDEPSEVPYEQFLMLRGQLTWKLPGGGMPPYMALCASNPEPGWVEEYYPIGRPGQSIDGKIFIPSLPRDNPHLPPGYEADLRSKFPAEWVTKYLDGYWGTSEGAVFKELEEPMHDLDNWVTPDRWVNFCWPLALYLAIDHASSGYVAMIIVGVDSAGNHYALDEYYEQETDSNRGLIRLHCMEMREKLDKYLVYSRDGSRLEKAVEYMLIDPSALQRTQQGQNQLQAVADTYRENGFPCIPAWNALELGLDRIKEHLHPIPIHPHPFSPIVGSPSLFISKSRCPGLWKDMRGLKKKVRPNGYIEFVGRDHGCDCLRYILNSRPRRPELVALDESHLDSLTLLKKRSEDRWARGFVKKDSGTFFGGLNFS